MSMGDGFSFSGGEFSLQLEYLPVGLPAEMIGVKSVGLWTVMKVYNGIGKVYIVCIDHGE